MNIALGLVALSLLGAEDSTPELISEVRTIGSRPEATVPEPPMTAYEVRLIHIPAKAWRPSLYQKCSRTDHQGVSTVWTLDESTVREFYKVGQGSQYMNLVMAPKVTAFDNQHAEISFKHPISYVADVVRVPKILQEDGKGSFRPVSEKLMDGIELKLETRRLGSTAQLGLILKSTWVTEIHTVASNDVVQDAKGHSHTINSPIQLPEVVEASVKGAYDVTEGHHLLVSLGTSTKMTKGDGPVLMERLALITPRRIILENEEKASVQKTTFETPKPLPQVAKTSRLPMPPLPSRSLLQGVAPNGQVVELPALPDAQVQTTSVHTVPAPQASAQATVVVRPSTSDAPQMGQLMRIDPNVAPAKFEPLPVGTSELLRPQSLTITPSVEPQTIRIPLGGNLAIEIKASVKK